MANMETKSPLFCRVPHYLDLCLSFTATIRWTDELTHTDRSMLMSLETDQGAPYLNFEKETVNTKAEVFLQTVREWMILLFGSGL